MTHQPQSLVESLADKSDRIQARLRYESLHDKLGPGRFNFDGIYYASHPHVPSNGYTGLALATSISRVHISRVLRGLVGVSLDVLNRIGEATGVGLEDLNWYIGENRKRNVRKMDRKPHTKPKPRRRQT
jgi:hypothetical protein